MQLTLDNVRKEYGETVALGGSKRAGEREESADGTGISLTVDDGEFFTLVGPSGCGKTTTLRLVAGFEPTTRGTIRFDGRAMDGVDPEDRGVGVVFQNYALFPHLSVAENVAYGLRFSDPPGGETREERVASLLELVDLPDAGDRDPSELSGGQRQRIALARALAPGPDLLLLDEPMSALDARLRERLRLQIKEIQSTLGITTLYVTHDQEEALAISDRVAVMHDGEIEQIGTPQEVYRRPATRFVAEFVGDNNIFEGVVQSVRPVERSEQTRGSAPHTRESPTETNGFGGGVAPDEIEGTEDGSGERSTPGSESRSRSPSLAVADVNGTTIPIRTHRSVSAGERVVFCVRPERMRVYSEGEVDTEGSENLEQHEEVAGGDSEMRTVLAATVTKTEFLGESTRSHLRWNEQELRVRSEDPLSGDVRVGFDGRNAHVVSVESQTL